MKRGRRRGRGRGRDEVIFLNLLKKKSHLQNPNPISHKKPKSYLENPNPISHLQNSKPISEIQIPFCFKFSN
jgi:hypothetical protein